MAGLGFRVFRCHSHGPFLGDLDTRDSIIIGTPKRPDLHTYVFSLWMRR